MVELPETANVIVVGAGPVGLALAAELSRLGRPPLILDRAEEGANTSRAAVIHARTLEVLKPLGVTERLIEHGVVVPIFRVRDRDDVRMEIDFRNLPTEYPFALMCPQNVTEKILRERLSSLGCEVVRPAELFRLVEESGRVVSTLRVDGMLHEIPSRWLVGCDGAHSRVRSQAGITFPGGDYEDAFVLADVQMEWPLSREEVSLFFSPAGLVVVAPLPGGRFRIVATARNAPEKPDLAFMAALLEERGPRSGVSVGEVVWSSRFHLQHRVASSFRSRGVMLCGDAAHVHSPAGGQGMNTGIQDAVSLAAALSNPNPHELTTRLDEWAASRHAIARDVVRLTDRMTRAATIKSSLGRSARNMILSVVGLSPAMTTRIARRLSELDNR